MSVSAIFEKKRLQHRDEDGEQCLFETPTPLLLRVRLFLFVTAIGDAPGLASNTQWMVPFLTYPFCVVVVLLCVVLCCVLCVCCWVLDTPPRPPPNRPEFRSLGPPSCETPALGPPGFHKTTRELQTCTFKGPGASNTTKIPREDTQERGERMKIVSGEKCVGPPTVPTLPVPTTPDWPSGLALLNWPGQNQVGQKWIGQSRSQLPILLFHANMCACPGILTLRTCQGISCHTACCNRTRGTNLCQR